MSLANSRQPTTSEAEGPRWLARLSALTRLSPALLSLFIHLTSLLTLAIWMVPRPATTASDEAPRQGEIVFARANSQQKTDYLDEATEESRSAAPEQSAQATASNDASAALPSEQPPELPAAVQLPSGAGIGLPAETFLPGVEGGIAGGRNLPSGVNEAAILAEDARRRGAGAAPVGTPGGLTLFGAQARGRSFAMVIDRSASMGDAGLGAIRSAADELARQLESLDENQRVQVVAYHAATSQLDAHWLPATEPNKKKLLAYLRGLPAFGSTNHTAALVAALKLKPEVIFLLTDGDDPGMDGSQLRIVRELARGRTAIHAIHFGRGREAGPPDHFLRKLAADSGGGYAYVDVDTLP
jgi:hypothetical protein